MTTITTELTDMIARINDLPDAGIRVVAMIGFARLLPQGDGDQVESERLPFMHNLACVETDLPYTRFQIDSEHSLIIDPDDQLPRLDFFSLVDEVAAIDEKSVRGAAFAHVVNCILSRPGWVAW